MVEPVVLVEARPPRRSLLLRLLKWGAIGVVLLIVVVILAAPPIVSSVAASKIPAVCDEYLNGKTTVGSVSFSWLSGVRIEGLRIGNPPGFSTEPFLEVKSVRIDPSLSALLSGSVVLNECAVEGYRVRLERNAEGTKNLDALLKPQPPPEKKEPLTEIPAYVEVPLNVRDGAVEFVDLAGGGRSRLEGIAVGADVKGLDQPIPWSVSVEERTQASPGVLGLKGTVRIGRDGKFTFDRPEAEAELSLRSFHLDVFAPALALFGPPAPDTPEEAKAREKGIAVNPRPGLSKLGGTLDGALTVSAEGKEKLGAKGKISLKGLAVAGPMVGDNAVALDGIALEQDFTLEKLSLFRGRTSVVCDFASLKVEGEASGAEKDVSGKAVVSAEVDFAAFFARLRGFLPLQALAGKLTAAGTYTVTGYDSTAPLTADRLPFREAGFHGETRLSGFSVTAPFTDGRPMGIETFAVDYDVDVKDGNGKAKASVTTDFASVSAEGRVEGLPAKIRIPGFAVGVKVDFAKASEKAAGLLRLEKSWKLAGAAVVNATLAGTPDDLNLGLQADLANLVAIDPEGKSIPVEEKLQITVKVRASGMGKRTEVETFKLTSASKFAEAELSGAVEKAGAVRNGKTVTNVAVRALRAHARIDLTLLLKKLSFVDLKGMSFGGEVIADASVDAASDLPGEEGTEPPGSIPEASGVLAAKVVLKDFAVRNLRLEGRKDPVTLGPLPLEFEAKGSTDTRPGAATKIESVAVRSDAVTLDLKGEAVAPFSPNRTGAFSFQASLKPDILTRQFGTLLPVRLGGQPLAAKGTLALKGPDVSARVEASCPALAAAGGPIGEKTLTLRGLDVRLETGTPDSGKTILVKEARLAVEGIVAEVKNARVVGIPLQPGSETALEAAVSADLGALLALTAPFAALPAEAQLSGGLTAKVTLKGKDQKATFDAQVQAPKLTAIGFGAGAYKSALKDVPLTIGASGEAGRASPLAVKLTTAFVSLPGVRAYAMGTVSNLGAEPGPDGKAAPPSFDLTAGADLKDPNKLNEYVPGLLAAASVKPAGGQEAIGVKAVLTGTPDDLTAAVTGGAGSLTVLLRGADGKTDEIPLGKLDADVKAVWKGPARLARIEKGSRLACAIAEAGIAGDVYLPDAEGKTAGKTASTLTARARLEDIVRIARGMNLLDPRIGLTGSVALSETLSGESGDFQTAGALELDRFSLQLPYLMIDAGLAARIDGLEKQILDPKLKPAQKADLEKQKAELVKQGDAVHGILRPQKLTATWSGGWAGKKAAVDLKEFRVASVAAPGGAASDPATSGILIPRIEARGRVADLLSVPPRIRMEEISARVAYVPEELNPLLVLRGLPPLIGNAPRTVDVRNFQGTYAGGTPNEMLRRISCAGSAELPSVEVSGVMVEPEKATFSLDQGLLAFQQVFQVNRREREEYGDRSPGAGTFAVELALNTDVAKESRLKLGVNKMYMNAASTQLVSKAIPSVVMRDAKGKMKGPVQANLDLAWLGGLDPETIIPTARGGGSFARVELIAQGKLGWASVMGKFLGAVNKINLQDPQGSLNSLIGELSPYFENKEHALIIRPFTFSIADGWLYYPKGGVQSLFGPIPMVLEGRIGLDQRLKLKAHVRAAKLEGPTFSADVEGTVSSPVVDDRALENVLKGLTGIVGLDGLFQDSEDKQRFAWLAEEREALSREGVTFDPNRQRSQPTGQQPAPTDPQRPKDPVEGVKDAIDDIRNIFRRK